jgi:tetratricopeptide (TPR) repeat protein
MARHQLIASLIFISIAIGSTSSTHAEISPDVNLDSLKIEKIDRATTETKRSAPSPQISSATQRSMRYVSMGWAEQKRGRNRVALILYYKAVKLDKTNAYAFMAAGNLLGDRQEGIICMKAAVRLFRSQGNQEGYNIATSWLEEHGVGD